MSLAEIDTVVPPNSVKLIDLDLRPMEKKLGIDGLAPLTLDWQVVYDMEGQPIELGGASQVVVERQLDCSKSGNKKVDGNLDDWKKLPFACRQPAQVRVAPDSWKGPADSPADLGTHRRTHATGTRL